MAQEFQTILVTGADGFIGSHLVQALAAQGRRVRAMVLYNSFGHHGWLDHIPDQSRQNIEPVMSDIRDPFAVRDAMRGCDSVMHLAALCAVPYSYVAPASYVDVNIMGTLNVLQAARDAGLGKIVITSTSEVYGSAQTVPIAETHPLVGQSPYAASKIGADQMALSYHHSYGLPVALARPFNTYGPRQSLRAVIPSIMMQALHGPDIAIGALHPTRDFNFVADTVAGLIAILDNENSIGEVINIGSGFEISIGDMAELIGSIAGKNLVLKHDPARLRPESSEVDRLCCDFTKAKSLLGWQPARSGREGLQRGLEQTMAWFANPENRAHYQHLSHYTL